MNNSAEKILYRKAALIFEELGFLMPRSDAGEYTRAGSNHARVSFNGPFSGCLLLSLSSEILPHLSANMLGEQGVSGTSLEQDALCEVANVICGNVLPAIYGFEPIFHLNAPQSIDESDFVEMESTYHRAARVNITFDAGHAEITLLVDKSQATPSVS
jgi:chemotaxis protein CheY-P-specific phosphatase CheC